MAQVPDGWKTLHDTRDGSLVYVYPDGSVIEVKKADLLSNVEYHFEPTKEEVRGE